MATTYLYGITPDGLPALVRLDATNALIVAAAPPAAPPGPTGIGGTYLAGITPDGTVARVRLDATGAIVVAAGGGD